MHSPAIIVPQCLPTSNPPLTLPCALPSPRQVMREGSDVTLVAFSKMVGYALRAAEMLEKDGISAEVRRQAGALRSWRCLVVMAWQRVWPLV